MTGKLHVYTGDGKGKTTAAMGLALRSLGHGRRVLIAQFLKDGRSGELAALKTFERATVYPAKPISGFVFAMTAAQKEEAAKQQNAQAADIQSEAEGLRPALTVLDELNVALACGMVTRENAERLIDAALMFGDVVSTGRNAPEWLRERADYVSGKRAAFAKCRFFNRRGKRNFRRLPNPCGRGNPLHGAANGRQQQAVNRELHGVFQRANRKHRRLRRAVKHREEKCVERDVDEHHDDRAGEDDLPEPAVAFKEESAVNHAAQRRRNREAGEIRPRRLEQKAQNIAQRALKRGRDRTEEHGRRRKRQMCQRNFKAVVELDHTVRGEHHLNGQKQADGGQRLRAAQGARRIGKFFEETRKNAVHQKTPPRIIDPASRTGMIRRDDRNKETVLGRRDTAKALFLRPVFFPHTST